MIRYKKLFDLLNERDMQLSDLRKIISSATVAKLKKGEYISGEVIEKICLLLDCQPGDIMEVVKNDEEYKQQRLREEVEKMSEPLYDMLKTYAKATNRTIREAWENYLKTQSEKKQKKEDFLLIKEYIEKRIEEDETK